MASFSRDPMTIAIWRTPVVVAWGWFCSVWLPAADKVDLADFLPAEVGANFTYEGQFRDVGRRYSGSMTLTVVKVENLSGDVTLQTRLDTVFGRQKLVEKLETRIEATVIRPLRTDSHVGSKGETRKFDWWIRLLPRVLEMGKTYRIVDESAGPYGRGARRGTARVTIQDVQTVLGTFNCVCLHQDLDYVDKDGRISLRRVTREWYARDFGLVRFSVSTSGSGGAPVVQRHVTVTSSSRPPVFNRAVK